MSFITLRNLVLGIGLLFVNPAISQTHYYQWAHGLGDVKYDHGQAVTLDNSGNVYLAGTFQDTVDFDPGTGTTNLISSNEEDGYIQKLDSSGKLEWVKPITSTGEIKIEDMIRDKAGNLYITGSFSGKADFDPGNGVKYITAKGGSFDIYYIFIAKLNASGNLVWAKAMKGNNGIGTGRAIAVDQAGNVYLSGDFIGKVDFDPGSGSRELTSNGDSDIFVQKLSSSGSLIWAHAIGGSDFDQSLDITLDTKGNVYFTGFFSKTVDLNPGGNVDKVTSNGKDDAFLIKLNSNGQYQFGYKMGSAKIDIGRSLFSNGQGKLFLMGSFGETVDFDPGTGTNKLTAKGDADIFIQQINTKGELEWLKAIGGPSFDAVNQATMNSNGDIFLTGEYEDSIVFDNGAKLVSNGSKDVLMVKINPKGKVRLARSIGSSGWDVGRSIAGNKNGDIFVTGWFKRTMTFGSGNFPFLLKATGSSDIFNLRLTHCLDTTINQTGGTLTANQESGNYQWLKCKNGYKPVSGATNQSFTPTNSGRYAVALANAGCNDTSACYQVSRVGIIENDFGEALQVYPNPTNGQVMIDLGQSHNDVKTNIFNAAGKQVAEYSQQNSRHLNFTLEGANGYYFIFVKTRKGRKARIKMLKQ